MNRRVVFFVAVLSAFLIAPPGDAPRAETDFPDGELLLAKKDKDDQPGKKKGHRKSREKKGKKEKTGIVHRYHYFPGRQIYYDPGSQVYFHRLDGQWIRVDRLPDHIRIDPGEFVAIELDTDRPYIFFEEHRERYKKGKDRHRDYRFYPRTAVYYDPAEDHWYVREKGKWKRKKKLPKHIGIDGDEHVIIRMDSDRPWIGFDEHRKRYPVVAKQRPFHFYPESLVYFDPSDKVWFFRSGDRWQRASKLPDGIRFHKTQRAVLRLDTPKPYEHFERHRQMFPVSEQRRIFAFYPSRAIYADIEANVYFVRMDGEWSRRTTLPDGVSLNDDHRVLLDLATDRPFLFFEAHREDYGSGSGDN